MTNNKFLDASGVLHLWNKIKTLVNDTINIQAKRLIIEEYDDVANFSIFNDNIINEDEDPDIIDITIEDLYDLIKNNDIIVYYYNYSNNILTIGYLNKNFIESDNINILLQPRTWYYPIPQFIDENYNDVIILVSGNITFDFYNENDNIEIVNYHTTLNIIK